MKLISESIALGTIVLSIFAGCGQAESDSVPTNTAADGSPVADTPENGFAGLTEPGWKRRSIPSDDELIAQARAMPQHQRMYWGWDEAKQRPMGWVIIGHDPDVFPVFSHEGDVLGMGVAGIGLIKREQLTDPSVDLEQLARSKWGPDYQKMVRVEAVATMAMAQVSTAQAQEATSYAAKSCTRNPCRESVRNFFSYNGENLCGTVAIYWDDPAYGGMPYAETLTQRTRVASCGSNLNGGFAGGIDSWVQLVQGNSVFGPIECGSRRTRTSAHAFRERAFNWNNCPAGQIWVAHGSVGGQLFDRYFEPGQAWLDSPQISR